MELAPSKQMSYDEALAFAKSRPEEWLSTQAWVLSDYLMRISGERPGFNREEFIEKFRPIEHDLGKMIALGEDNNMIADYDLETESIKSFCRRKNIELIP